MDDGSTPGATSHVRTNRGWLERRLKELDRPEDLVILYRLLGRSMTLVADDYAMGISSCGKKQMWRSALDLFQHMVIADVRASAYTYNISISSCHSGMQWQQALKLFAAMCARKLLPDVIRYNTVISSCQKGMQAPFSFGFVFHYA